MRISSSVSFSVSVTARLAGLASSGSAPELAVEILRVLRRGVEMHEGLTVVAESASAVRPSQYSASANCWSPSGRGAEREEMSKRRLGLRQKAQGDPAGEELRLDISVAPEIGPCCAAISYAMRGCPELSAMRQLRRRSLHQPSRSISLVRLARRVEQHLPGFLVAVLAP